MPTLFFNLLLLFVASASVLEGANQTATVTPIITDEELPFTIELETWDYTLPTGIQGHAAASFDGKWIFIAGRTNGLHGFDNEGNNFPPASQNRTVWIFDPETGESFSRSLEDSDLIQTEIDDLSVTAPEFYQQNSLLYLVGGYGINTESGEMETKDRLTVIDLKKLILWVIEAAPELKPAIRQVSHPILRVTGGYLSRNSLHEPFLLMLGQNFEGLYTPGSNGEYTKQIRRFWLLDDGKKLAILAKNSDNTSENYRRRDLNVVPILHKNKPAYTALSGVFTTTGGIWNIPIAIESDGKNRELDPEAFKQGMNNYNSANFGLYSVKEEKMYITLAGGISYGYFDEGVFATDAAFPFINQLTTITVDKGWEFKQYFLNKEFPVIASTGTNPGNRLLFGAEATFFPAGGIPRFSNGVIQLDKLSKEEPITLGYITAGIMSTLPNTNSPSDSTASPYIFKVKWVPAIN